jgi:hypothetical protein
MEDWPLWNATSANLRTSRAPTVAEAMGTVDEPWTMAWWRDVMGSTMGEFYLNNMKKLANPRFITVDEVVGYMEFSAGRVWPSSAAPEVFDHNAAPPRGVYAHINMDLEQWASVAPWIGTLPTLHRSDDAWLRGCLGAGDGDLASEFMTANHWRMALIGTRGAGMFNHKDTLKTISFHAHVRGHKRWHICAPTAENDDILQDSSQLGIDLMRPDYDDHPGLRDLDCFADELGPGDVLVYPADYWHQTEVVESLGVFLTGTLIDDGNHAAFTAAFREVCRSAGELFDESNEAADHYEHIKNSPDLCRHVRTTCEPWWNQAFGQHTKFTPNAKDPEPTVAASFMDDTLDLVAAARSRPLKPRLKRLLVSSPPHMADEDEDAASAVPPVLLPNVIEMFSRAAQRSGTLTSVMTLSLSRSLIKQP